MKTIIRLTAHILAAALLLTGQHALAGKIYMLNGDVITGDIKKIWDEDVTIEPAYADEFTVDLDAVSHMESDRLFDIEFPDGREMQATLAGGEDGTQVLVVDGVTQEVSIMALAELDEPEDAFDWDSFIDFNSVVNTGNTQSINVTLQAKTNLKLGDHRHIASLSVAEEEQTVVDDTGVEQTNKTKDQDRINYSYNWSFKEPWFAALNAAWERDPIRDLNYRYTIGTGVGYDIFEDAWRFWQIQPIVGYLTEEFDTRDPNTGLVIGKQTNDSVTAGWVFRFKYEIIGDLNFFHDHMASANISGRTNSYFQSSTGVRYEITDLLYANLQFDADYESEPAAGNKNTDTTTLIGLGLEF
jgi:putative salt-induced outer membrane protein YdiY